MDRLLKNYIAPFFYEFEEIKAIVDSEQEEFNNLNINLRQVLNNAFILETNEYGIERYEKMLKIVPKGTDTLQDRQFRVLTKFQNALPYTLRYLENAVSTLCDGVYTMEVDYDNYTLTIKIGLSKQKSYDEIVKLVNEVVPANIISIVDYLYNKYLDYEDKFTYSEMAVYTYKELRESEAI